MLQLVNGYVVCLGSQPSHPRLDTLQGCIPVSPIFISIILYVCLDVLESLGVNLPEMITSSPHSCAMYDP